MKSPIVGTFYRAADPNSPPFVSVGDRVKVGQVLCIIEAMKLMNEIEAEVAGEVVRCTPRTASPCSTGIPSSPSAPTAERGRGPPCSRRS